MLGTGAKSQILGFFLIVVGVFLALPKTLVWASNPKVCALLVADGEGRVLTSEISTGTGYDCLNLDLKHYPTYFGKGRLFPDRKKFNFNAYSATHDGMRLVADSCKNELEVGFLKKASSVSKGTTLTTLSLPSSLLARLSDYLYHWSDWSKYEEIDSRFLSSITYFAGLSPQSSQYPWLAFTGGPEVLRGQSDLEPGSLIALAKESQILIAGIHLGGEHVLVRFPGSGGRLAMTSLGFLADAEPSATLRVLLPDEGFRKNFPMLPISTLKQWSTGPPLTWEQFDFIYSESLRVDLRYLSDRSGENHLAALARRQRAGHPELRMETLMGIEFHPELAQSKLLSLREFDRAQRRALAEEIRRYDLSDEDVFTYARPMLDRTGQLKLVPYGGFIDPSWKDFDLDRTPPEILGVMLQKGAFPHSLRRPAHDRRHHLGLVQYAHSYSKPYREFLRTINLPTCRLPSKDKATRSAYILESLALVPERNRTALKALLHPIIKDQTRPDFVSVGKLNSAFSNWEFRSQVLPHARALLQGFEPQVEFYGGGARDFGISFVSSSQLIRETIPGMAARLENLILRFEGHPQRYVDPYEPNLLAQHEGRDSLSLLIQFELARLESMLWGSTFLTAAEFIEGLGRSEISRRHPLYRFIVETGVLENIDGSSLINNGSISHSLLRHSR